MGGAVGSVEDRLLSASTVRELKWREAESNQQKSYKRSFYKYSFEEAKEYCAEKSGSSNSELAMPKTKADVEDIVAMFQCEYHALC